MQIFIKDHTLPHSNRVPYRLPWTVTRLFFASTLFSRLKPFVTNLVECILTNASHDNGEMHQNRGTKSP